MADASTVIRTLGQQIAQLSVDKALLETELAEARERIAELGGVAGTGHTAGEADDGEV